MKKTSFKPIIPSKKFLNKNTLNKSTQDKKTEKKENIKIINENIKPLNSPFLIKDNSLYPIILFLDLKSIYNFMLVNKRFFNVINTSDELWYNVYCIREKKKKLNSYSYDDHRGNWKKEFLLIIKKLVTKNYDNLKKNYLLKNKKKFNKKDHFYLQNNIYQHLESSFTIQINDKILPSTYTLQHGNLTSVNIFYQFSEKENKTKNDINKIKILFTSHKYGIYGRIVKEYDNINQINFKCNEHEKYFNKYCTIYYKDEFIISTLKTGKLYFINITLIICKLCEVLFPFIKNFHKKNIDYLTNLNGEIELYDFSLFISLRSYKDMFFSIVDTNCNFKEVDEKSGLEIDKKNIEFYYINDYRQTINKSVSFDVKTLMLNDKIENFLIMDISLLSYNGDHILCESKPLFLKNEKVKIILNDPSINYIGKIIDSRYNITFKFLFNKKTNEYSLDYTEFRINKNFIYSIIPK